MSAKKAGDQAFARQDLLGTRSEPTYAGALSFMRRRYTRDLDGVDLVVTGVPLDLATTNRPGARFGPRAIECQVACRSEPHIARAGRITRRRPLRE